MAAGRGGERRTGQPGETRASAWADQHRIAFFSSLSKLLATPLASLMTAAVIGIALALPATFYALLQNAESLGSGWDSTARISLYLSDATSDERGAALASELTTRSGVDASRHISRAAALDEFRAMSGFGEVLDALDSNPLPGVIVVRPHTQNATPESLAQLAASLQSLPEVDDAVVDLQWIQRLYAIIDVVQRAVLIVAALLSLAVLLVVGNTIRLDILGRREEIVVTKLIGATNGFVRRPFLYSGAAYGLLGGLLALLMVVGALALISSPVESLAELYGSGFRFSNAGVDVAAAVLLGGLLLGLGGAWLAVGRHLDEIEPR
jgi:cell division transport system permease protein